MNHRAAPSPRSVTRGESTTPLKPFDGVKTSIDWVHATWHLKTGDIGAMYTDPQMVRDSIFDDVERFKFEDGKGIFGFQHSSNILTLVHGEWERIGIVAWGGKGKQADMGFLQITGVGCAALGLNGSMSVRRRLRHVLELAEAKLTRLDIAFDTEEIDILQAVEAYKQGEFITNGLPPSFCQHGDWEIHRGDGRTLYIGKMENGKCCCIYEKGKQLGDKLSKWLRVEQRWGNRDRIIPLDALVDTDTAFAGASPFCARLVHTVGVRVRTFQQTAAMVAEKAVEHATRNVGRLVNVLADAFSAEFIVNMLRRKGAPKRLVPWLAEGHGFYPDRFFGHNIVSEVIP